MRRPRRKHKCRHCQVFFDPDPRSAGRQRHCSKPECRKASKKASQLKWRDKPANRDYFKGPDHVQRVRQWRQAHPGYWRRQASKASHALQDDLTSKANENQSLENDLEQHALQDTWFVQPAVWVGLISHLRGITLQDDIATAARRWQQLGHDILSGSSLHLGDTSHDQASPLYSQAATPADSVQLGGSAPGP